MINNKYTCEVETALKQKLHISFVEEKKNKATKRHFMEIDKIQ